MTMSGLERPEHDQSQWGTNIDLACNIVKTTNQNHLNRNSN